jgi:hypothetical protein
MPPISKKKTVAAHLERVGALLYKLKTESIWQCPEVIVIPVARIGWRCKRATERAGPRPVLVTRRLTRDEARQIAADVVGA